MAANNDVYNVVNLWRDSQLQSLDPILLPLDQDEYVDDAVGDLAILSPSELLAKYGSGRAHTELALLSSLTSIVPSSHWSRLPLKSIFHLLLHDEFVETLAYRFKIDLRVERDDVSDVDMFYYLVGAVWKLQDHDRVAAQSLVNELFAGLLDDIKELFDDPFPLIPTSGHLTKEGAQRDVRYVLDRLVLSSEGWTRTELLAFSDNLNRRGKSITPNIHSTPRSSKSSRPKKSRRSTTTTYSILGRSNGALPTRPRCCCVPVDQHCSELAFSTTLLLRGNLKLQFYLEKVIKTFLAPPPDCPVHESPTWFKAFPLNCTDLAFDWKSSPHWEMLLALGRQVLQTVVSAVVFEQRLQLATPLLDPNIVIVALVSDTTLKAILNKAGMCPTRFNVSPSAAAKAFKIHLGTVYLTGSRPFSAVHQSFERLLTPVIDDIKEKCASLEGQVGGGVQLPLGEL
ncbi:hypothetical protein MIND_01095900 [Mycena indigotica]|uniref:Uncharacterized protein n=1 Tax=Mycena indigotica TaxID=2126181 RepID=A0A8H6VVJ9_9AGAR|nr:uncharacterized protein MIND_01095900 [Mycena indigotica]KAF7295559.1 hypothetical protein MIND_01095900 [Mycena indigotica]